MKPAHIRAVALNLPFLPFQTDIRPSTPHNHRNWFTTTLSTAALVFVFCGTAVAGGPIDELPQYLMINKLPTVLPRAFGILIIAIASVLLYRTSVVKERSRFMRHIAAALVIACISGASITVAEFFEDHIATQSLISAAVPTLGSTTTPKAALEEIQTVALASEGWDTTLSFCATFSMLLAWSLLRQYPHQGIPRDFYVAGATLLGTAIALANIVTTAFPGAAAVDLLDIIDMISSVAAIGLVGWQLSGITASQRNRPLPLAVLSCYWTWALSEALYYPIVSFGGQAKIMYSVLNFILPFAAAIITVVFCSLVLEDKVEFAR